MLLRDLADAGRAIAQIVKRLNRLEHGSILENASVTDGRLRFIRGLLRLDSGARLEGVGTFQWEGPGSIKGDFEVLGDGRIRVGNVIITPVGGGRIQVGTGVVIDGATGKITAGDLVIDPTVSGGAIVFANGAQVFTNGDSIQVYRGNSVVQVTNNYARLQYGGNVVEINGSGVRMSPAAIPSVTGTGLPSGTLIIGTDGYLKRAA